MNAIIEFLNSVPYSFVALAAMLYLGSEAWGLFKVLREVALSVRFGIRLWSARGKYPFSKGWTQPFRFVYDQTINPIYCCGVTDARQPFKAATPIFRNKEAKNAYYDQLARRELYEAQKVKEQDAIDAGANVAGAGHA
jgi:hypothetical protein